MDNQPNSLGKPVDNQPDSLGKPFDSNLNISITVLNTILIVVLVLYLLYFSKNVNIREDETEEQARERGRKTRNLVAYIILGIYFGLCVIQTIISMITNGISTIWYLIIYLFGPIGALLYAIFSSGTPLPVI